jgi:hypothetical protein
MPRRARASETDRPGEHVGYSRQDSRFPWRQVCRGESWRGCWLSLVEQVRDLGDDVDLIVLEERKSPCMLPGAMITVTEGD